jgi:DNA mismatch repair protein MutS2
MIASESTLAALEFPQLLRLLAAEARTDLGAARLRDLVPTPERVELERRRAAASEVARLAIEAPFVPSWGEELAPVVARLESGRTALEGAEILLVAAMLRVAVETVARIERAEPPCPELARRLRGLGDPRPLVAEIERVLDAKGRVRDDASARLVELAREVRGSRDRLYSRLERLRGEHAELFNEETVSLRDGRLQLLLSSGGRGRIAGLVHGRSASGKSFYFEPLEVVEENNTLETALDEQDAERARLLRDLLAALVGERELVARLAELVGEVDALEAILRLSAKLGARFPELASDESRGGLQLRQARHPLLDPRLARLRGEVLGVSGHTEEIVPLELALDGDRRVLVVTGPNAGGKTVALKTLGLLVVANQAGLPIPCAAGTELPIFDRVVATVGDEQDLLEERSTFSGRLARLSEAWRGAGPRALALVDELGSGTDPEEGAALAQALVERLVAAGGWAFVTTHLTPLALAAFELPGAACAAMEFERATGLPTFRLRPGPPGGSEAIALARRMGLPEEWIVRAEAIVGGEARDLRRALAELEAERVRLDHVRAQAEREAETARLEAARLERERATLEAERRTVGKRLERELASFRTQVRRELRGAEERLRAELESGRRRGVAAKVAEQLFADAPVLAIEDDGVAGGGAIEVGAAVRHRGLGWNGVVERIDGSKARVTVGGKRLATPIDELIAVAAPSKSKHDEPRRATEISSDESPAELMLLGFTVEDALAEIDATLDRALRTGRAQLRIVHGHGTGRLREAVREHLRRHPAVAAQRAGAPNEGGNGATIVELA